MAALNAELRKLIRDENWNKHEHVQWIVNMANEIAKNLVSTLRGIWTANEDEKIMDKLIESLIGDPGDGQWSRNFLTHLNLALLGLDDNAVEPRPGINNAVVPALNARNTVLYRNLNALLTAIRTHTHPVAGAAAGPCFPATCPTPIQVEVNYRSGRGQY